MNTESQATGIAPKTEVKPGGIFGRWEVVRFDHKRGKAKYWLCRCSCSNRTEKVIGETTFRYGGSTSCGCYRNEVAVARTKTHGQTSGRHFTREYTTWANMIQRCTNPNHPRYSDYGGRGVLVCEKWMKFEGFLEDMGNRPDKMTLDRWPNGDGDYCKSNCRWATIKEQNSRKRNGVTLEYRGEFYQRHELASKFGLKYETLKNRIKRGWSVEDAVETKLPETGRWAK